jgi:HTH-type transcriptional regulator, quorum sensing regulator NprR
MSDEGNILRPRRRGRRSMAEMRAARENGIMVTGRSAKVNSAARSEANSLGARVRLARKRLGLSQQELAGPQYVASYISAIERDKIHPSLKALELIAKRLAEPVEYFLYGGYGSGALQEVEAGAEGVTSSAPESSLAVAVRDQLRQAQLWIERGAYLSSKESQELFDQASTLVTQIPRHQLTEYDRAQLSHLAGILALRNGTFDLAISELEEAIPLASRTNQISLEIELHYWLGSAFFARRMADQALTHHQMARELLVKNETQATPELHLQVLTALADDHLALGHPEQTVRLFEEALHTEEEYDQTQLRADRFWKLTELYQEKGDLVRSRNYCAVALSLYEQLNQRRQILRLSSSVGELLTSSGKVADAEKILTRAVDAAQNSQDLAGTDLALTYNALASLRIQQGKLEEAGKISQSAIEEARKAGDQLAEGNALRLAAEVEAHLDHQAEARKLYEQAITILEATNTPYALGDVYKAYGEALSRWGDFEAAVNFLKKAYDSKR